MIKQVVTSSFTFTALITLEIQLCLPLNHTPTASTTGCESLLSSANEKEPDFTYENLFINRPTLVALVGSKNLMSL